MAVSAIFRTAEHAVGGDLRAYLEERRQQGQSFDTISKDLAKKNVLVSFETVRLWCKRLDIQKKAS